MAAVGRPAPVSPERLEWGRRIDRVSNVALVACAAWMGWCAYYEDRKGLCLATAAALTVGHGSHILKVCLGIPVPNMPDHL